MSRSSLLTVLIVCFSGAAGLFAASVGGRTETLFDWLFVGIPLLLVAACYAINSLARFVRRREDRGSPI